MTQPRREARVPIDLELRVWGMGADGRVFSQPARTGNVSIGGALLSGIEHDLKIGDTIGVQHGEKKARCKVVPFNLAQGLRALAHGQAHGGSGKDDRSHGPEPRNRSTVHPIGVGDRPWVILPVSYRQISAKFFGMMVARDGVEPL
jgi:hypothetical protein